jgi:hypothetical protein
MPRVLYLDVQEFQTIYVVAAHLATTLERLTEHRVMNKHTPAPLMMGKKSLGFCLLKSNLFNVWKFQTQGLKIFNPYSNL